jgi:CII-binding regulator of phage lambda lysogenization HflD
MNEHRIGHDGRINMLNISLNILSDDMDNKVSINEALAGRTSLTKHMTASHQQLVRLLADVQDDIMSEVNGTRTIVEGYIEEFVNGLKVLA